jgi:hypothetical protein
LFQVLDDRKHGTRRGKVERVSLAPCPVVE